MARYRVPSLGAILESWMTSPYIQFRLWLVNLSRHLNFVGGETHCEFLNISGAKPGFFKRVERGGGGGPLCKS